MSADDAKIIEWKQSWLPNLMGSEVGKWMLANNLMEYYSEAMIKDLQQAAAVHQPNGQTTTAEARP
jgi:hypothetical protein